MHKAVKILLIIFVIILLLMTVLSLLFRANLFLIIPYNIEYKIASSMQINKQKQEAEYRTQNPPTEGQIAQMQSNKLLCFHNDDCRVSPEWLADCNNRGKNKHYRCKGGSDCGEFQIGCPSDQYFFCEDNVCKKRDLDFQISKKILTRLF